jgi:MFS family permease
VLRKLFPNVYEGWLVVASVALIVTLIGAAFFYGFGLIFTSMEDEFGWSKASISLAFSLRTEAGGLAAPVVGMLVDRLGPQRVLTAGIGVMALGVVLLSYTESLWQFYATMIIIAIGTSSAGGQVGMVATASWFERRRGRALSVMTLGGGLAGTLVAGVAWLVDATGWRNALRWMGLIVFVLGVPLALNVRGRPRGHPQPMDGLEEEDSSADAEHRGFAWGIPPRRAVRTRSFILLAGATAAIGFGTTTLIVHQIPFLESVGISKGLAGASVGLFTLMSIIGRLGFGYLADRTDKRVVLAAACALVVLGLPLLALVQEFWQAMLVLAVVAPGFGGSIPVRPALLADYFGTLHFGTLNGLLFLVMTVGSFFGPLLVGWIADVTGEYTLGWLATGAVTALSLPALLVAGRPSALIEKYRVRPSPPATAPQPARVEAR